MHNLAEILTQLSFNIKAEALTGALLESSPEVIGSDQVMIRPLGILSHANGLDVLQVAGSVFDRSGKELIYLDVNREGLYDTLPEMLFIRQEATYEDEVERAQHLARQKEIARQFFLPFEEVFYRSRIDLELTERTTLKELADLLLKIYGLEGEGADEKCREQMRALALVLPRLNQVIGNLNLTGSLLSAIIRKEVKITQENAKPLGIPEGQQTLMGQGMLGVDLMLGDSFADGIRSLALAINNVQPEEVEDWLPGGNQRQLLENQLLPYVLPAGEQVEVIINLNDDACCFALSSQGDEVQNVLGYTTKIKN